MIRSKEISKEYRSNRRISYNPWIRGSKEEDPLQCRDPDFVGGGHGHDSVDCREVTVAVLTEIVRNPPSWNFVF